MDTCAFSSQKILRDVWGVYQNIIIIIIDVRVLTSNEKIIFVFISKLVKTYSILNDLN